MSEGPMEDTPPSGRPVAAFILSSRAPDRVYSLLNLANNCAGFGMDVVVFCTFDGLDLVVRGDAGQPRAFSGIPEMFRAKDRDGRAGLRLASIEEQFADCRELGVRFMACDQSIAMRGLRDEDLLEGVPVVGAGSFIALAKHAAVAMYI